MKTIPQNFLFGIIAFFSLILLEGCYSVQPIGYRVTTQNVPMLENGGDVQAHCAFGLNHAEMIVAISPVKHIGLIGSNYSNELGRSNEYGVGTYYSFRNGLKLEAYASAGVANYFEEFSKERYGLATGSGRMDYDHSMVDFAYTKRNLQMNVGLKKRYGIFSISVKWTRAYYDHYKYLSESYSRESWNALLRLDGYFYNDFDKRNYDLLAIAPTYSYRGKWFFCQAQFVMTGFLGNKQPFEPNNNFYRPLLISTSFGVYINPLKPRGEKVKSVQVKPPYSGL